MLIEKFEFEFRVNVVKPASEQMIEKFREPDDVCCFKSPIKDFEEFIEICVGWVHVELYWSRRWMDLGCDY